MGYIHIGQYLLAIIILVPIISIILVFILPNKKREEKLSKPEKVGEWIFTILPFLK